MAGATANHLKLPKHGRKGLAPFAAKSKTKESIRGAVVRTDAELRKLLEDEWGKWRPRIPMGERRINFAIACMRMAYDLGRDDMMSNFPDARDQI